MKSTTDACLLRTHEISVNFGNIPALQKIDIEILESEIHAIIGEHGAGKSTFAKVISGFQPYRSGKVVIGNKIYDSFPFSSAQENGITIVHQYNPFFEDLLVGEYFYLDSEMSTPFLFRKNRFFDEIDSYFAGMLVDISSQTAIKNLRQSDRIFIDVCKKIRDKPRLLILDEALEQISTDKLGIIVSAVKALKDQGVTTLIITHRVDDILEIADRISVFKDGRIIYTDEVAKIDKFHLVQMAYTNFNDNYTASPDFFKYIKYNEAILQKLPVNLLVIDNNFKIKIVNEQIESFFGLPTRDLLDSDVLIVFSHIPKLIRLIQSSIEEKKAQAFFRISIQINKQERVCKVNTLPIIDGNLCIGSIVLLDDITEQEKLREQLQLSENLSSIGLLAAGVAHEINNPLEIINYLVEDIRTKAADPSLRQSAESIREEVGNISHIIHNLMDFSGSPIAGRDDVFDIGSVLTDLIRLIRLGAEKKHIEISYVNETESAMFRGNKTELRQVFLNIIRNSFEAIVDSGHVEISLQLNKTGNFLRLSFQDNGPGIDEENISRIFLPFFSTKKHTSENSGLGLSLSYGIINNHGGRITVQKTSPGTKFIIELPYEAELQLR